jgi:hypothetical protein
MPHEHRHTIQRLQISLPEDLREAMHLHPGQESELSAAISAGIASGQGRPSEEIFERLESKYRS